MKPESPSFRPITFLAFAACLSGCASDSGFFRVRNPFPDPTAAVSSWVEKKETRETPQQEDSAYTDSAVDPTPAPSPYFGRR
jgi:hypothetical protein